MRYLVFVGAIIHLIGVSLYIKAMFKRKVKPNKVTWLMWSVAPLIGTFAALSAGVGLAVIPLFMMGVGSLLVFIISLFRKNSYWKVNKFDYICGILSVLALVLWYITKEPIIAIIFSILSDFFAAVPTIIKAWKYPETESSSAYIAALLSALTSFAAIKVWNFESLAFPCYLVIFNISAIFLIERGRLFKRKRDD